MTSSLLLPLLPLLAALDAILAAAGAGVLLVVDEVLGALPEPGPMGVEAPLAGSGLFFEPGERIGLLLLPVAETLGSWFEGVGPPDGYPFV